LSRIADKSSKACVQRHQIAFRKAMSEHSPANGSSDARAERLAAQLRANLRRRKAHTRAQPGNQADEAAPPPRADLPKDDTAR